MGLEGVAHPRRHGKSSVVIQSRGWLVTGKGSDCAAAGRAWMKNATTAPRRANMKEALKLTVRCCGQDLATSSWDGLFLLPITRKYTRVRVPRLNQHLSCQSGTATFPACGRSRHAFLMSHHESLSIQPVSSSQIRWVTALPPTRESSNHPPPPQGPPGKGPLSDDASIPPTRIAAPDLGRSPCRDANPPRCPTFAESAHPSPPRPSQI